MHVYHNEITASEEPTEYIIQGLGEETARLLRTKAAQLECSLSEVAVKLIEEGLGKQRHHHDLDRYAGSWAADSECDRVLVEQRFIEDNLWA